jgi:hypothetical protein
MWWSLLLVQSLKQYVELMLRMGLFFFDLRGYALPTNGPLFATPSARQSPRYIYIVKTSLKLSLKLTADPQNTGDVGALTQVRDRLTPVRDISKSS